MAVGSYNLFRVFVRILLIYDSYLGHIAGVALPESWGFGLGLSLLNLLSAYRFESFTSKMLLSSSRLSSIMKLFVCLGVN